MANNEIKMNYHLQVYFTILSRQKCGLLMKIISLQATSKHVHTE